MKGKKHTPEQVIRKLVEGDKLLKEGQPLAEVVRSLQIGEATWHRWKAQYGGMGTDEAKRMKEMGKENSRLRKIVSDLSLDIEMLKEIARGKF